MEKVKRPMQFCLVVLGPRAISIQPVIILVLLSSIGTETSEIEPERASFHKRFLSRVSAFLPR